MRARALSDLRSDAYLLMDVAGATERFPASEVSRYVNQGIAWVWEQLVAARGYAYYGKQWLTLGSVTSSGTTPPTVTATGAPTGIVRQADGTRNILVDVVTGGALATMTYRISLDGGSNYLATVTSTAGGTDYVSDLNVSLTFASGTYNADNLYTIAATVPTTTANLSEYALPADFYKLSSVLLKTSSTTHVTLQPFQSLDEANLRDLVLSPAGTPAFYDVKGTGTVQRLELLPLPSAAYDLEVKYVPSATILVDDADAFDGLNGFEDAATTYAARRMALKNREDELAAYLQQDLQDWERRIRGQAQTRDTGRPPRVQDAKGTRRQHRKWLR